MRIGHNPNRQNYTKTLAPIVLSVVTHLPDEVGYHSRRMEVIEFCFQTMLRGAQMDISLAVWDNGSNDRLLNYLQDSIKPDILIRSQNIGLTSAKASLFGMLPEDTIVAYSDDDMLFYPDWLRPQIALLNGFPNVASVTGYPVRTAFRWGTENTIKWATHNGAEYGRFLPQKWEDDFAVSIGRDPAWHREYTREDLDYRIEYRGLKAYLTSHHCQFVARAGVARKAARYDGKAMADERYFDIELDKLGLRLATQQRLTRHIGNVLHDELRKEIV